jgi:hypothetical protein
VSYPDYGETDMMDQIDPTESAASSFAIFQNPFDQIRESFTANFGNNGASVRDMDRIKMPAGDSTAWTVRTLSGEELVKELIGIPIGWQDGRAYWSKSMEESDGNAPPDCYSLDAKTGIGKPGGDCRKCPYAQFGSDPRGLGQACKSHRELAYLLSDRTLPVIVCLSATSIKPSREYIVRLASVNIPFYGAITAAGLERTKSNQGKNYPKATFRLVEKLNAERAEFMKGYTAMVRPLLQPAPEMLIGANIQPAAGELI